jgi:uncharacterized lipoprotein YddW (UPF0748 family)
MGLVSALAAVVIAPTALPPLKAIPREFRAAWVATVANIDWPSKPGLPVETQREEMVAILNKAQELNLNALVWQVRPACDALYDSKFEPWSEYLTGAQGKAPEPYWDPLAYLVQEAHKRGIEVHCWFNPYRAKHPTAKSPLARTHIGVTNPNVVKSYGKYLWMDPGEPMVQKRSIDVMLDVTKRYDVDGIHMDDYFYPYPEKDSAGSKIPFPDDPSWRNYQAGGGRMNRDDWRRENVDGFIKRLYDGIKKEKRWVKFGISPFGIYRPGVPETIKAGVDQYGELYADCLKWYEKGWVDYFTPQLYWPISQTAQAYPTLLKWWAANNASNRNLWPGNYTSQVGEKWKAQEIVDQIDMTREMVGSGGNVHFSMKSLMVNAGGLSDMLKSGPYATPAFVPASPWLASSKPAVPEFDAKNGTELVWRSSASQFAVCALVNGSWTPWQPCSQKAWRAPEGAESVAVVAFDRANQESPALVVKM